MHTDQPPDRPPDRQLTTTQLHFQRQLQSCDRYLLTLHQRSTGVFVETEASLRQCVRRVPSAQTACVRVSVLSVSVFLFCVGPAHFFFVRLSWLHDLTALRNRSCARRAVRSLSLTSFRYLSIKLPPHHCDVNVHPTKNQVSRPSQRGVHVGMVGPSVRPFVVPSLSTTATSAQDGGIVGSWWCVHACVSGSVECCTCARASLSGALSPRGGARGKTAAGAGAQAAGCEPVPDVPNPGG